MGSVAKPAKTLEVLLNHLLQAFMAGAVVFSGGQGYVNFNTLLAPFARGRTYEEIKQAIQGFVFNCNMSLVCRGGQILFSSIGVDLSVPEVLAPMATKINESVVKAWKDVVWPEYNGDPRDSDWILIDANGVLIHLFTENERIRINLEDLLTKLTKRA